MEEEVNLLGVVSIENVQDIQQMKNNNCLNCGKCIWPRGLRCKSCESKRRNNSEWLNKIRVLAHKKQKENRLTFSPVECLCGCGELVYPTTKNKTHRYVAGHQNIGRKRPDISKRMSGSNHPLWKGGITPELDLLRNSVQYKKWRKSVFERDDYTCQTCGKRGVKIVADHIKPFAVYPKLRFETDNGRVLCNRCHRKTDTYGVNFLRYNYV